MKTILIDLEVGNIGSVVNAVRRIGHEYEVLSEPPRNDNKFDRAIISGVGSFPFVMKKVRSKGWDDFILSHCEKRKPLLGICVGMQILSTFGYEDEECRGLDIIPGVVRLIKPVTEQSGLKLPHVGWNNVVVTEKYKNHFSIFDNQDFYFTHSYAFNCAQKQNELFRTYYGGDFCSGVVDANIIGVQFHPEKSSTVGHNFMKFFVEKF